MPWLGITVAEETKVFLLSCLLGGALGVVYDIFRILRVAVPHGRIGVLLEDMLYCLILTFCNFLFFLQFCRGYFRFYVLLGEGLGFLIYFFTVGILVIHAAKGIITWIKKILFFLYRITIAPILRFLCLIGQKIRTLFRRILQKCSIRRLIARQGLKPDTKVLYNKKKDSKKRLKQKVGVSVAAKQKK